ncbi:MAG: hypothetical protein JSS66_06625 [Armatimonadetes bacterium]|nr:hypothetical protein [Armatimonadota bacterium]
MDIKSGCGYPAASLSNFSPHKFVFDGVECASMEGWLQSLKFKNPDMQEYICSLVGFAAKKAGKAKDWRREQKLYWQGLEFDRHGEDYQALLDRAYTALCEQSSSFRNALERTGDAVLKHSIGRTDPKETILTRTEFCSRLMKLREKLKQENSQ